jgi:hypothetical protein
MRFIQTEKNVKKTRKNAKNAEITVQCHTPPVCGACGYAASAVAGHVSLVRKGDGFPRIRMCITAALGNKLLFSRGVLVKNAFVHNLFVIQCSSVFICG